MKLLTEVAIALVGVVLTVVFAFVSKCALDPAVVTQFQNDPTKALPLLAIQFELVVVALSLLVGAAINRPVADRGRLLMPLLIVGTCVPMIMLGLAGVSQIVIPNFHPDWMRIGIPVLIGAATLFLAIQAAANP